MRRHIWLISSAILFCIACALPAVEFRRNESGREIWSGLQIVIMGWLELLLGHIAWLANPLLAVAAVCLIFQKRLATVIFALLALLLSLETFTLFSGSLPGDEADVNRLYLHQLREGAFFWWGSLIVMLIGGFRCPVKSLASAPRSASASEIALQAGE